jgi:CO/xanthine dehydrogenase Mo-binding subunit
MSSRQLSEPAFDGHGQLLTASLLDYCLPRADNLPSFDFETRNVPSTTNPMGLKGAGEAGSIGSTPAVMNAIADALWRAYRVEHIDMPATAFAVFRAIKARGPDGRGGNPAWNAKSALSAARRAMVGDFGDERRQ